MSKPVDRPEDAQDRLSRIESLTDTGLAHVEMDTLLRQLLDRVRELLDADSAMVLMHDNAESVLVPTAVSGLNEDVDEAVRVPVGRGFAGSIAAQKRPIVLDRVDETTVLNRSLWEQGLRTLLGVPMLAEGNVVGVLHVGSLTKRRFTDYDAHLLQVAADRIALATQAVRSRAERAAAAALQRSLMPARLPAVPGAVLAARYLPGGVNGVGGDWYDVFTLPSGRLGVVIGDIVGQGLPAAVIMGRLRSALRAYALEFDDPAVVLEKLDRKVTHFEPDAMATVTYAIFDPRTHRLALSLAGHPPPVYRRPDHPAAVLDVHADLPIGARLASRHRRAHTVEVAPGGVVCFYTDGLVERRDAPVDEGLARLCDAIDPAPADAVCATVMHKLLAGEDPGDDIAVVVLSRDAEITSPRVRPSDSGNRNGETYGDLDAVMSYRDEPLTELDDDPPSLPMVTMRVPARADQLTPARRALTAWARGHSFPSDVVRSIELASYEAMANVAQHAYRNGDGELRLSATAHPDWLHIAVVDQGEWRDHDDESGGGMGLALIRSLADHADVDTNDSGTTVSMTWVRPDAHQPVG
ncbi:GAF domain-containing protein [Herbihabitans rhizosphaerae]|uniref:GAF domain-containing protein n=1 Tax=Herbihabitans rhizosphaerae TaxID=1872711 RepID=A0A4V2ESX7_9PSEU|nr:SpoIIE family protein phosphatase [Herbihabitans rhizosphaerae]RZS39113.1 GAF domain-containing protein [Herbihabitans rhizosphaerae]